MRADLLALTADDLASFSNRGLTRRAEQEASAGVLTCELVESPPGDITARWSDGVECRLPAGARLVDSRCSCPSTTLCRHVLRTVFAYQKRHADLSATIVAEPLPPGPAAPATPPAPAAAAAPGGAWNPATIADAVLAKFIPPAELTRRQREFAAGQVIQVWTGAKPRAVLHTLGCAVNFRVPHDVRYAVCDCSAEAPCGHVALAVWAFRRLGPEQTTGLVSTGDAPAPFPTALGDDIECELMEVVQIGLARTPPLQVDRWRRLADRTAEAGLIWPAEILREIAELHAAYLAHDARFNPRDFTAPIAELLQRLDAIRSGRTPVPALFVRGSTHDRETEFDSARLIGVGCTVRVHRGGVEIAAHLQDCDSGTMVAVTRDFSDPPSTDSAAKPLRSFPDLARTVVLRGSSLAALGRGQLLIKGGRRTPSGRLLPGRAPASVSPQAYAWENLRAPVRVSGFAELREQLRSAAPIALGPRQLAARLTVCPVRAASDVEFSTAHQKIVARLSDPQGDTALLVHPFFSRGAPGAEKLISVLRRSPNELRFICAQAQLAGTELVLSPLSLVYDDGGRHTCVQPWTDETATAVSGGTTPTGRESSPTVDPLHDYLEEVIDRVAETWLTGLPSTRPAWSRLATLGASLGFRRLASLTGVDTPAGMLELTVVTDFAHREFVRLDKA